MTNAAQDSDVIEVDVEWYTLDEIEYIEQQIGDEFTKFMNVPGAKTKHMRILALIIKRRTDPDFPEDQVGSLKISFKVRGVPPTNGNGLGQKSPLPSSTG